ncbi:MAG: hypothetical protein ACKVP0_14330 [Pirellulaceae bacterium]
MDDTNAFFWTGYKVKITLRTSPITQVVAKVNRLLDGFLLVQKEERPGEGGSDIMIPVNSIAQMELVNTDPGF